MRLINVVFNGPVCLSLFLFHLPKSKLVLVFTSFVFYFQSECFTVHWIFFFY